MKLTVKVLAAWQNSLSESSPRLVVQLHSLQLPEKETMSDHIPQEVIVKILSQLPVKSLIRFRCVFRTWFSLICCHDFITLHHSRALSNAQNSPYLLFRHYDQKIGKDCFTLLSSDNPFPLNLKEDYFTCPSDFIEMRCPHRSEERRVGKEC